MASLQDMTDSELLEMYEGLASQENPEMEHTLLAEIERRNLDI